MIKSQSQSTFNSFRNTSNLTVISTAAILVGAASIGIFTKYYNSSNNKTAKTSYSSYKMIPKDT